MHVAASLRECIHVHTHFSKAAAAYARQPAAGDAAAAQPCDGSRPCGPKLVGVVEASQARHPSALWVFRVLVPPPVRRSRPPLHAARAPQAQRYADPPQTPFSAPHPARRAPHRRAARAQVDVRSLRLENAPRAALEVARSDSVALMGLNVSAGHGAGVVVDGSQHVYIGGSAVAAAGDALLVQASTGARRRLCG